MTRILLIVTAKGRGRGVWRQGFHATACPCLNEAPRTFNIRQFPDSSRLRHGHAEVMSLRDLLGYLGAYAIVGAWWALLMYTLTRDDD